MRIHEKLSMITLAITLGFSLTFIGCSKQESDSVAPKENFTDSTHDPDGLYYFASDGSLQKLDLESVEYDQQHDQERTYKSGNSHINAHYSYQPNSSAHGFWKSTTFQLNATENNQGVSGTGHIWRTWGENSEFSFKLVMDADCLDSNGEEAVFVGTVTKIIGDSPGFDEGARIFVRVKDNGQGPNASPDQYRPSFVINPSGAIPCDLFGLNSIIWTFNPLYEDVANSSDYVNIK